MAGKGGKTPGAGRKPGIPNKINAEIKQRALEGGILPLEYMLKVMRDESAPVDRRDDMAKAAASYVHPRLAASTVTVNDKREATDWTREELVAFLHNAVDGSARAVETDGRPREPDSVH